MTHRPRRFDLSPDNFIAGVSGILTASELGVYWAICLFIYSKGGPVLLDEKHLKSFLRGTDLRTIRSAINRLRELGKIDLSDGYLEANGCRKPLEDASNRMLSAIENGSKGGRRYINNNSLPKPGGLFSGKLLPLPLPLPSSSSSAREEDVSQLSDLSRTLGLAENDFMRHMADIRTLIDLKGEGCDFERHIRPAAERAAKARKKISSLAYIAPKAREMRDAETQVASLPTPFRDTDVRGWNDRLDLLRGAGTWSPPWGPRPGEPGCRIPAAIIEAHNKKQNGKSHAAE